MPLDLNDLRSAAADATADAPHNPGRAHDVQRRVKRSNRRRAIAGVVAVATAATLAAVPFLSPVGERLRLEVLGGDVPSREFRLPRGYEPPIGDVPVFSKEEEYSLPIDAVFRTDVQIPRIQWAADQVVRTCMRRYGLDWPQAGLALHPARPGARMTQTYGVFDEERAVTHGYGFPSQPGDRDKLMGPPGIDSIREPTGAEQLVFSGRDADLEKVGSYEGKPLPDGGCYGEAKRTLGENPESTGTFVQELNHRASEYARKDGRMSAANALWSSCMKDAGFSYMTPQKAAGNERWQHRISTEEIATAKADVACKQKTNVIGIGVALERAYQQGLIDRNRLRLGPLIKDQATLIKSVDAVIRKAV